MSTSEPFDVYVADNSYGGFNHYIVMVNGEKYDEFVSTDTLTWAEQYDVASGYREALDNYVGAC